MFQPAMQLCLNRPASWCQRQLELFVSLLRGAQHHSRASKHCGRMDCCCHGSSCLMGVKAADAKELVLSCAFQQRSEAGMIAHTSLPLFPPCPGTWRATRFRWCTSVQQKATASSSRTRRTDAVFFFQSPDSILAFPHFWGNFAAASASLDIADRVVECGVRCLPE